MKIFSRWRSFTPRKDASHQSLYSRPTTLQFDKVRRKNRSASPPVTGNRLKTLHSLLYFDRRVNPSESATKLSSEQLQSNRSEWEQTFSRNPETNVDRTITLCSSSLNLTHGFFVKSKFDSNLQPIDQVTSWDDVWSLSFLILAFSFVWKTNLDIALFILLNNFKSFH